jgi:hypothetical protein
LRRDDPTRFQGTDWCRAEAINQNNTKDIGANYGLPCVTGALYWEDGSITIATNCLFCGKELPLLEHRAVDREM